MLANTCPTIYTQKVIDLFYWFTIKHRYLKQNLIILDFGEVDFVVIGGGSAGAVVAGRLSEINAWNVLLLEAGKDESNFTEIPSMGRYVQNSEYNWGFNSTPQETCCLGNFFQLLIISALCK